MNASSYWRNKKREDFGDNLLKPNSIKNVSYLGPEKHSQPGVLKLFDPKDPQLRKYIKTALYFHI